MDNKPSKAELVEKAQLAQFEPIAKLSPNRLNELANVCIVEHISKDLDPTRMSDVEMQAIYLLKGDLGIRYENGNKVILRAGTAASKYPVDTGRLKIRDTIALTPLEITRIDLDLIDIMMTWDQISGYGSATANEMATGLATVDAKAKEFKLDAASFNAFKLQNSVFSKVPPANIEAMLARLTLMKAQAGQIIVTQGQEGDYYYLIKEGTAVVSRIKDPSQPPMVLAEISHGAAFGEEALASDTKRNATVTMKTDGELLRLNKQDFIELLKAPIVNYVDKKTADEKISQGAQLLDVRFASEYRYQHLDGAINTPLHELRNIAPTLDQGKEYIVYCQTGRRSSAAAFILAQLGLTSYVLNCS